MKTQGSVRFAELSKGWDLSNTAKLLELHRKTLERLRNGTCLPSLRTAVQLQREYDIEVGAWFEPAED